MRIEDFQGQSPRFVPEEFFAGRTSAWGIFQDRFGNLRRQFKVDVEGRWDGETLTLVEDFVYDDGETEQRTWTIWRIDDHTYEGKADGVVGVARGRVFGNALNWNYEFALPIGGKTWQVKFDDWMLLQDEHVMINRASVSKWGLALGEATIFFAKDVQRDFNEQPLAAAAQ
jgi:hypothetical protein